MMGDTDATAPLRIPKRLSLKLSKTQAATRQLEAAILALERGEWDIAITLAAASEGMLDSEEGLFARLRDHPLAQALPKKKWIHSLNRPVYWLKHGGAENMTIKRVTAVRMVLRAYSKIGPQTP